MQNRGMTLIWTEVPFIQEVSSAYRSPFLDTDKLKTVLRTRKVSRAFGKQASGAIIENGDRKSQDPRAPMVWDNFAVFKTNCDPEVIYPRWSTHVSWMFSRCAIKWQEFQGSLAPCFSAFFTVMTWNQARTNKQGAHIWFYALSLW